MVDDIRKAAAFPTVPFEGVYLVTDELGRATHAEVDELERTLGFRMPHGYREYVTTLGEGDYCDILRVFLPRQVLAERGSMRQLEFRFDRSAEHATTTFDQFVRSVPFACSSNGDLFSTDPDQPDRIICLPEDGGSEVVAVDACGIRLEDLWWRSVANEAEVPPAFRTFESDIDRHFRMGGSRHVELDPETIVRVLEHRFARSERRRVDVTLGLDVRATVYLRDVQGYVEIDWSRTASPAPMMVGFRFASTGASAVDAFGRWLVSHGLDWF